MVELKLELIEESLDASNLKEAILKIQSQIRILNAEMSKEGYQIVCSNPLGGKFGLPRLITINHPEKKYEEICGSYDFICKRF